MENKRLIDANALYDRLTFKRTIGSCNIYPGIESAIAQLRKAPTVDAVEVVHGRWEPDLDHLDGQPYKDEWYGYIFKCSACGGTMMGDGDLVCRDNYCPHCGAKMDGGNEDV